LLFRHLVLIFNSYFVPTFERKYEDAIKQQLRDELGDRITDYYVACPFLL